MSNSLKDALVKAVSNSPKSELATVVSPIVEIKSEEVSDISEGENSTVSDEMVIADEMTIVADIKYENFGPLVSQNDESVSDGSENTRMTASDEAEPIDSDEAFFLNEENRLVINGAALLSNYSDKPVEFRIPDPSAEGGVKTFHLTTEEILQSAERYDTLIENQDSITPERQAEIDMQISELHDNLAELLISKHGLVKVGDSDLLFVMSERQAINDMLINLFKELDAPISFTRIAPANFKTVFSHRVLGLASIANSARQIISNFKNAVSRVDAAEAYANELKAKEARMLAEAEAATNRAHRLLAEAKAQADANTKEIAQFNLPSDEKLFVLRGRYITQKKSPKGDKITEKKRRVYLGLKKNFKTDRKTGMPLSKYFFATTDMAQAHRFQTSDEAAKLLVRAKLKFGAGKFSKDSGFNKKKMDSLVITRINMEFVTRGAENRYAAAIHNEKSK